MIWLPLSLYTYQTKDIIPYTLGRDAEMQNTAAWVIKALSNIHYSTLLSDEKLLTITSVYDKLS